MKHLVNFIKPVVFILIVVSIMVLQNNYELKKEEQVNTSSKTVVVKSNETSFSLTTKVINH
ncbi:hypothetical protein UMM65_02365 [Aureibaculum sp. 2210JD6-5]|uniref:hypothetical protein n=1 Tax=Aureibaculum sp. 2210JD6-5 TaxID=3103957 RepID=UPI002AAEB49C|nr:hypothetical protein [Aureibaculum sp. 2210JD6-5]MDY7394070.1 hypothetical protein [Aureibaculum sp. 2210JD6-5]